jgi:hypothetical protein
MIFLFFLSCTVARHSGSNTKRSFAFVLFVFAYRHARIYYIRLAEYIKGEINQNCFCHLRISLFEKLLILAKRIKYDRQERFDR